MSSAIRNLTILGILTACWCLPSLARAAGDVICTGPCRYDTFPGKAAIVSVAPLSGQDAKTVPSTPYPPLAVTYTFTPDAPIVDEPLYVPGNRMSFTLLNGMPPGPRFAAKYGLEPGKVFACQWQRIVAGTCTPALYVFPDIDRTDYFELTQP